MRLHRSFGKLRFAIVGSGPAGFYTSKLIMREIEGATVDIFEKDLLPYGLIRHGVAPDHQSMKKVVNDMNLVGKQPGIRLLGGAKVGTDVHIDFLTEHYSAVIYSYGAEKEWSVDCLAGDNVVQSKQFISWYNSHPDFAGFGRKFIKRWPGVANVAVVGNGNVALDVARMLGQGVDRLKSTDVSDEFIEFVQGTKVKNITILGRRGVLQSSFAIKELRDLTKLEKVRCWVVKEDIDRSLNDASLTEISDSARESNLHLARILNKKLQLFQGEGFQAIGEDDLQQLYEAEADGSVTNIIFRFLVNPVSSLRDDKGRIKSIQCEGTRLEGKAYSQQAVTDQSRAPVTVLADLAITCVGYYAQPILGIGNFDERSHVLPNAHGCVLTSRGSDHFRVGLYCAGWVKSGAKGVIDSTMKGAEETYNNMKNHILAGKLAPKPDPFAHIQQQLKDKQVASFEDWLRIDELERKEGSKRGKVRHKLSTHRQILDAIGH